MDYSNVVKFAYITNYLTNAIKHCDVIEKHLNPEEEVLYVFVGQKDLGFMDFFNTNLVALTNKRIIMSSGFIGIDYQTIFYKDIKKVNLNVGFMDKIFKVGDLYFYTAEGRNAFLDIGDCYELYPKIQKVVLDIQTDIEFPNNLRPNENDGYNTKYNSYR